MNLPRPSTAPETLADQQAEDSAYYRQVLHQLIDAGADLALMVHAQAKAQVDAAGAVATGGGAEPVLPETVLTEAAGSFDRLSRCVRRTIALAQRVSEPVMITATMAGMGAGAHRVVARRQILRDVEDTIRRVAADLESETGLNAEAHERLDDPELDIEIDTRSVPEIVQEIRRDLGLEGTSGGRPWKRRMPEDVRVLYARAAGEKVDAPAFVARPWFRVGSGAEAIPRDADGLGAEALMLAGAADRWPGCGPP